jgi:hypothetical protein
LHLIRAQNSVDCKPNRFQTRAVTLNELINGVKPDLSSKEKLIATREKVLKDWLATEKVLRVAGKNSDADRVLDFVNSLPPIKTDHDLLREQMLADKTRLQAALNLKPPTVDKAASTPGDDFTMTR